MEIFQNYDYELLSKQIYGRNCASSAIISSHTSKGYHATQYKQAAIHMSCNHISSHHMHPVTTPTVKSYITQVRCFQRRTSPHWRLRHSSKLWLYQHSVGSDKNVMHRECNNRQPLLRLALSQLLVSSALQKSQIHPQVIINSAVHPAAFTLVEKNAALNSSPLGIDGQEVVWKAVTTVQ